MVRVGWFHVFHFHYDLDAKPQPAHTWGDDFNHQPVFMETGHMCWQVRFISTGKPKSTAAGCVAGKPSCVLDLIDISHLSIYLVYIVVGSNTVF